jgi:hypothetical protein
MVAPPRNAKLLAADTKQIGMQTACPAQPLLGHEKADLKSNDFSACGDMIES